MMAQTRAQLVEPALKAIATALVDAIRSALAVVNLDGSKLQDSIETETVGGDTIVVYMIEYGQWVISGRRKFVKKVPISALLIWIKQKGFTPRDKNGRFMSLNRLAFAIQNAIYKNGIKGRDFITPAINDEFMAMAEDLILEALSDELDRSLATVTA